ncbi:NAD-dependent epimerase/dehydratase family protein [Aestuariibaculum suncheonense]|uniref:NAD-dependent epimerase/dehydratase family protein n=1 Tax=Aestuariibaculum suncheonense TaxID=1028745 RepID=A0A8J6UI95_9FLAO|nr:NAD-dependent epimerase/dehydratase family protein [Aestuariibaculum suncheonense]MBD0836354.1 NAD-dependent epimerase/dehydratase family protein [Aestuariibaculum suncheonense]
MKVLVTGATGYIGHQLAMSLASKDVVVHALCRDIHSFKVPTHKNIMVFEGDLCEKSSIEEAIKGCDYVFHTAAFTNLTCKNIHNFYQANVVGTEHLLEASLEQGVKKFVFTSTLSVYGPSYKDIPITEKQPRLASYSNDYELTKSMAEEKILAYSKRGLPYVILNVSKVYGPGIKTFSNGVSRLIELMAKKDILFVPDRTEVMCNYVYIKDVVKAHIKVMRLDVSNERYIIGGDNISYNVLFQKIKRLTNSKIRIIKFNYSLVKLGVVLGNVFRTTLGWPGGLTPSVLDALFVNRSSMSDKARKDLKYKATSLEKGLNQTIKTLKLVS